MPITRSRQTPLARLLAFVLLALVAYVTSAEAVHRHGNLIQAPSATSAISVGQPGHDSSSLKDSYSFSDCLICQLHQQLSGALFTPVPQVLAPEFRTAFVPAASVSLLSETDAPRRGRAPPTSLI